MWPVFSYLPGGATISRVAIEIVARHGWKMLTHTAVAAVAAWGAWTWATGDPVRKEVPAPEIPDIRVTAPDKVQVARDTTTVMDTTCAAIPKGIVAEQKQESSNGLPEVEYGDRPPYITVEVTRQGPAVEVTPSAVTLQGYDPAGKLRSYRYERDRRRLSLGPYIQTISQDGRLSVSAGAEARLSVPGRWQVTGRAGKLARTGWAGSLSLTYNLL